MNLLVDSRGAWRRREYLTRLDSTAGVQGRLPLGRSGYRIVPNGLRKEMVGNL